MLLWFTYLLWIIFCNCFASSMSYVVVEVLSIDSYGLALGLAFRNGIHHILVFRLRYYLPYFAYADRFHHHPMTCNKHVCVLRWRWLSDDLYVLRLRLCSWVAWKRVYYFMDCVSLFTSGWHSVQIVFLLMKASAIIEADIVITAVVIPYIQCKIKSCVFSFQV